MTLISQNQCQILRFDPHSKDSDKKGNNFQMIFHLQNAKMFLQIECKSFWTVSPTRQYPIYNYAILTLNISSCFSISPCRDQPHTFPTIQYKVYVYEIAFSQTARKTKRLKCIYSIHITIPIPVIVFLSTRQYNLYELLPLPTNM